MTEPTFESYEDCARCSGPDGIQDDCPACKGSGVVPPHHHYEPDDADAEYDRRRLGE